MTGDICTELHVINTYVGENRNLLDASSDSLLRGIKLLGPPRTGL